MAARATTMAHSDTVAGCPPQRMDAVIKQGILRKQGHVMHTWKTRFFTLTRSTLAYYTEENGRKKGAWQLSKGLVLP